MNLGFGDDGWRHSGSLVFVSAAIALIAYFDWAVLVNISLGYLYVIPLVVSATEHRLRTALIFAVVCVVLREAFGPFSHEPREAALRVSLLFVAFLVVIVLAHRMGERKRFLARTVQAQRDQFSEELEMAAALQRRLLPQQMPNRAELEVAARMVPARVLGGDFYDCLELADKKLGLAVGDVAGKGTPAALVMPAIMATLRMAARRGHSPSDVLSQLNETVQDVTDESRYATVFYGVLDAASSSLSYCNGGHHPPLLIRAADRDPIQLETGGPVVGLLPNAEYRDETIPVEAGDLLILFSDGLIEAERHDREQFGVDRLLEVASQRAGDSASSILDAIVGAAMEFENSDALADDLTVIVCKVGATFGISEKG